MSLFTLFKGYSHLILSIAVDEISFSDVVLGF